MSFNTFNSLRIPFKNGCFSCTPVFHKKCPSIAHWKGILAVIRLMLPLIVQEAISVRQTEP